VVYLVLGLSLLVNVATCSRFAGAARVAGRSEYPEVEETLAYGSHGAETKVAMLELSGTILRDAPPTLFGEQVDPVTRLLNEIQAAIVDPEVRAILLNVNSPGGGVTASDEIYHALKRFRESDPDRRIVVHVGDMAASGGYYAALAGDVIVAQPTSIIGSVGVMLTAVNAHGLGEKLGVRDVSLTSSENKDLLHPLDPVDPEHQRILQRVVDDLYDRFAGLVLEHRPFDAAFAAEHELLDGRVFTASEARELGMVDEIGYGEAARAKVLDVLGVEEAGFVRIEYTGGWSGLFSVRSPEIALPGMPPQARFLYLWKP